MLVELLVFVTRSLKADEVLEAARQVGRRRRRRRRRTNDVFKSEPQATSGRRNVPTSACTHQRSYRSVLPTFCGRPGKRLSLRECYDGISLGDAVLSRAYRFTGTRPSASVGVTGRVLYCRIS